MALGTTRNNAQTALCQYFGHGFGIELHLFGVFFPRRLQRFFKCHRFGSNHVHQRAALQARENGGIDFFRQLLIVGQHDAAARAAQSFVGSRSGEMSVRNRVRIFAGSDQTGVVRHVDKQISTDFVGDFAETFEINFQGVGRSTGHNHFRLVFQCQALDFIIVDGFVVAQTIGHHFIQFAGNIHRSTMGKMAAMRQIHPQNRIARLQY